MMKPFKVRERDTEIKRNKDKVYRGKERGFKSDF